MSKIFFTFLICIAANVLIASVIINMNYTQNKDRGLFGSKGTVGAKGKMGNRGPMGDNFKLDSCDRISSFVGQLRESITENGELNNDCFTKISAVSSFKI